MHRPDTEQADESDDDQVHRHNEVQQLGHDQDQNPGHQRDQRCQAEVDLRGVEKSGFNMRYSRGSPR